MHNMQQDKKLESRSRIKEILASSWGYHPFDSVTVTDKVKNKVQALDCIGKVKCEFTANESWLENNPRRFERIPRTLWMKYQCRNGEVREAIFVEYFSGTMYC
jgi:hypothetical protein